MACSLCGNKKAPWKVKKGKKELTFCYKCRDLVTFEINGGFQPILWVGKEDLVYQYEEEDTDEAREMLSQIDTLTREDYKRMADAISEYFYNSTDDWYSSTMKETLLEILQAKEEDHLKTMPKKDLPLMIGNVKYKKNEKLLDKLMRGNNGNSTPSE